MYLNKSKKGQICSMYVCPIIFKTKFFLQKELVIYITVKLTGSFNHYMVIQAACTCIICCERFWCKEQICSVTLN